MNSFFDKLGDILRSYLHDDGGEHVRENRTYYDPDMQEAMEELDEFLKSGRDEPKAEKFEERHYYHEREKSYSRPASAKKDPREELRADYAELKVPFGASFEVVKKSYKNLLRMYHPDKHADDPEKLRMATEITKKINQAFQRIEKFEETGKI